MTFDFKELQNDENFKAVVGNLTRSLDSVEESITTAVNLPDSSYEAMPIEERVKYDLFLSYTINSLFWMHMRLQAVDPNSVSVPSLAFIKMSNLSINSMVSKTSYLE